MRVPLCSILIATSLLASDAAAQVPPECSGEVRIYFQPHASFLTPAADETLGALALKLSRCEPMIIVAMGHIDGAEKTSSPNLGQARAKIVADRLRGLVHGAPIVSEDAGSSVDEYPSEEGAYEPLNRRVVIYIRG